MTRAFVNLFTINDKAYITKIPTVSSVQNQKVTLCNQVPEIKFLFSERKKERVNFVSYEYNDK